MQKFFDLSPTLVPDFPTHPAQSPIEIRRIGVFERDGYRLERLNITSHTGAHIDAPAHLIADGKTVDEIPIEDFIGPCVIVDLRGKKEDEPIQVSDLEPFGGSIQPGVIVLLVTGWSRFRSPSDRYVHHSPYLTAEAAQWLVARKVKGVAVDHFTIATTDLQKDMAAHVPLLRAGIWILEDLDVPEELLKYKNITLYAVPLKLAQGSGMQARPFVVAEIPQGDAGLSGRNKIKRKRS